MAPSYRHVLMKVAATPACCLKSPRDAGPNYTILDYNKLQIWATVPNFGDLGAFKTFFMLQQNFL